MQFQNQPVRDFLNHYQMNHQTIDIEACCQGFLAEMRRGLNGQSSMAMLPTYIEAEGELPRAERVIVIDAGGTNLRVATVYFDHQGEAVIENFSKYPMPGSRNEVGKAEFFNTIAAYVKPIADGCAKIGFCFSYPMDMLPNRDGKLLRFSKQIQAPEVVGELIGANLQTALAAAGCKTPHQIVLLNDTVAALLAGKTGLQERSFDSYIGFIFGTGINVCYIEQNANIGKCGSLDPGKAQIINTEVGGYLQAPVGQLDRVFDQTTVDPGKFTYEKMVSGRYLGGVCFHTMHQAARDGLFTPAVAARLQAFSDLSTVDVNRFLTHPAATQHPLGAALSVGTVEDRSRLYLILDNLVERAAKLAAANLGALVLQSDKGTAPDHPVCISADGTTFYQLRGLRFRTEHYLYGFLTEQKGRYFEIVNIENAPLIGAAIAGLING